MKNETIVLIVAFIGIVYIMFHHNTIVAGNPTNVSPASILGGTNRGSGSSYSPPSPLSNGTNMGGPTCTGGSCGGAPTGPVISGGAPPPPLPGPPIVTPYPVAPVTWSLGGSGARSQIYGVKQYTTY